MPSWSTSVLSSDPPNAFVRLTRLGFLVSQFAAMLYHDHGDRFDSVSHNQDLLLIRTPLWMAEKKVLLGLGALVRIRTYITLV